VRVIPSVEGAAAAVCAFTFHTVIAVDVAVKSVHAQLPEGDIGAPLQAPFLQWLARKVGRPAGVLDVVLLAARRLPAPRVDLVERDDLDDHPRVRRASRYRTDCRVFADGHGRGIVVVGRGVAGRWEVAFEVDEAHRDRGVGRALAAAARELVPSGEPLFAQVAPGNASSLRAVLAAGYVPVGSEVLFV
jgi:GNAT superfamily N-acetyltransferase